MPSDAANPLDAHLGYWMRIVSNHVSHAFAEKVAAHGATVAEWVLMRVLLDHDSLAPSQVAEAMRMTRGAISKLVDRLVAKGLVVKTQDGEDRRFQSVALTPAGRVLVPTLAGLADANDAEFFGSLTPQERAALNVLLRKIVSAAAIDGVPVD